MNDRDLLTLFVERGDGAAFAVLSRRYIKLVYSTCLREVGNVPLAEDATQAVFLLLARKAAALRGRRTLSGWLFHAARLAGRNVRRDERTRAEYERRALEERMRDEEIGDPAWSDIDAGLHDALSRLPSKDRDVVLLRFFEDLSFSELGSRLEISEDAARVRVNRALGRLRGKLAPAGGALTAVSLAALLSEHAAHAADAACLHSVEHLPSLIAGGPLSSAAIPLSHHIVQGVTKAMLFHQLRVAAVVAVAAVCGAGTAHIYANAKANTAAKARVSPPSRIAVRAPGSVDPFAALQLSDGFTLRYHVTSRDVRTPTQFAAMIEDAKRQYRSNAKLGDMPQRDADRAIAAMDAQWKNRTGSRSYEVVLSAAEGKLCTVCRKHGGDHAAIASYDGVSTSVWDDYADRRLHLLRVYRELRMNDEWVNLVFLPGVGFPDIPIAKRPIQPAVAGSPPGAVACDVADIAMGFEQTPYYRPGFLWRRMVDGAPQVTKMMVGTLKEPIGVWTFDHFRRLRGGWVAGHSRLTHYTSLAIGKPVARYPMDQTDYVMDEITPDALPPGQFDVSRYLAANDLIAESDGAHDYTAFRYDPQGGDVETQFQKHLADHTVQ